MSEPEQKFLVAAGSGIGNILLATPLVRSLRRACPKAVIDVLVPSGRSDILQGNPDVTGVLEARRRPGLRASARFLRRIWRRYDLALCAQAGDRAILNASLAARRRFSHVKGNGPKYAWQRLLLQGRVEPDKGTHAVIHGLRLLDLAGVARCYETVPPTCPEDGRKDLEALLPFSRAHQPYVVMHQFPRNRYKCWTHEGWAATIAHVASRGLPVVLTGDVGKDEQQYIDTTLAMGVRRQAINLSGRISLPQVSDLLGGAALYVGPDTGITHLAATRHVPTVALYGPTSPVYWGPWPAGYAEDTPPFARRGCQTVNNVSLVQADTECVACDKEGCYGDPHRSSRCMQELQIDAVLTAVDDMLKSRQDRP